MPVTFTIKSSLSIKEEQNLNFGTIVSMPTAQTIRIDTDGRVSGGNFANSISNTSAGLFSIYGAPNAAVNIKLDNSAVVANETSRTMTAALFSDASLTRLDYYGTGQIKVGGSLDVNPNQPAGQYTGTYTVSISY